MTAYVYPDAEYEKTLGVVDGSTPYGLTGAVFARDLAAIQLAATGCATPPATST